MLVFRDSGVPADMEANFPSASIKFANIRIGEIGSTFPGGGLLTKSIMMIRYKYKYKHNQSQ